MLNRWPKALQQASKPLGLTAQPRPVLRGTRKYSAGEQSRAGTGAPEDSASRSSNSSLSGPRSMSPTTALTVPARFGNDRERARRTVAVAARKWRHRWGSAAPHPVAAPPPVSHVMARRGKARRGEVRRGAARRGNAQCSVGETCKSRGTPPVSTTAPLWPLIVRLESSCFTLLNVIGQAGRRGWVPRRGRWSR